MLVVNMHMPAKYSRYIMHEYHDYESLPQRDGTALGFRSFDRAKRKGKGMLSKINSSREWRE